MKSFIIGFLAVVALFSLSSCKEKYDVDGAANFKTESFKNFLWKKQPPVTIEAVINTDFAECEEIDKPLVLQLCDDDAKAIPIRVAQLYVNGEKSEDNTITIVPKSGAKQTEIKIVLDESQLNETRTFTWNLQVVDNPGLVKINERQPGKDPWIADTTVNWKNKKVANPLRVGTDITLFSILSILVAWIILAQLVLFSKFKSTQIKKIFVMVDGGRKNIQGYNQSVVGAKEIVLTPNDKSQSFLKRLFLGKVIYVRIKGLPGEISLTPGDGKFQTKSVLANKKAFGVETSGDMNEIKTIKSLDGDFAVEYYAKRN
jgi:hypothetical protein